MRKNNLLTRCYRFLQQQLKLLLFHWGGRQPWQRGYFEYKWGEIKNAIRSEGLLRIFAGDFALPLNYGAGLDERVIEYPWLLANLSNSPGKLLDAGSVLNFEAILNHPKLNNKEITIITLAPETNHSNQVSYRYADLRSLPLPDNQFDIITCVSTLEHIGMDNTLIYTADTKFKEQSGNYLSALLELKRVLKPGGNLFITVPFGKYENHGFFQQFNSVMLEKLILSFGGTSAGAKFYKYNEHGWQLSNELECANLNYYNVRTAKQPASDGAAAARAVACIKLIK